MDPDPDLGGTKHVYLLHPDSDPDPHLDTEYQYEFVTDSTGTNLLVKLRPDPDATFTG